MAAAFFFLLVASPARAQLRDRTPPTAPTNLRVTEKSAYSVTLAWNPSTDNSGSFSYTIRASNGHGATVGQTATSFRFTSGLEARGTYSFVIYAVDRAGNRSRDSNTVTVSLPADTFPPTAPRLSVTDVGPTHVSLALSGATDDGPYLWYQVFMNGSMVANLTRETSVTIKLLTPATKYSFTARARDFGANFSPSGNTVSVTTPASDPNDTTPPTTPANFYADNNDGCGEMHLSWTQSTDNVDAPSLIRYEVFVNGVLDHLTVGTGRTVLYATVNGQNTFAVVAVDSAGNRSAPASITIHVNVCP